MNRLVNSFFKIILVRHSAAGINVHANNSNYNLYTLTVQKE
jgi:hypothetical protein